MNAPILPIGTKVVTKSHGRVGVIAQAGTQRYRIHFPDGSAEDCVRADLTIFKHLQSEIPCAPDPADVRKVVLEEPPGNRPLADEMVTKVRTRLFGSWEMNWIAYNFAHDVALPGSSKLPLGFLMYPQAETAAGRLDCLDPENFRYTITAREISG